MPKYKHTRLGLKSYIEQNKLFSRLVGVNTLIMTILALNLDYKEQVHNVLSPSRSGIMNIVNPNDQNLQQNNDGQKRELNESLQNEKSDFEPDSKEEITSESNSTKVLKKEIQEDVTSLLEGLDDESITKNTETQEQAQTESEFESQEKDEGGGEKDFIKDDKSHSEYLAEDLSGGEKQRFEKLFKYYFENDRMSLILKYKKYFAQEIISPEIFDEFMFEFANKQEIALENTRRDMGYHNRSDADIQTRVRNLETKLKKYLSNAISKLNDGNGVSENISRFVRSVKHNDGQASILTLVDDDSSNPLSGTGNCVARSLLVNYIALHVGFEKVGVALMPNHISTVAEYNDEIFVFDSILQKIPKKQAGKLHMGGAVFSVFTAVEEPTDSITDISQKDQETIYNGQNPSGTLSNLQEPTDRAIEIERDRSRRKDQDSEFKQILKEVKFKHNLSHLKSDIMNVVNHIEGNELREAIFKRLSSALAQNSIDHYFNRRKEIIKNAQETQMFMITDEYIEHELSVSTVLENMKHLKDWSKMCNLYPCEPLRIRLRGISDNMKLSNYKDEIASLNIIWKPDTLLALPNNLAFVDGYYLKDLEELKTKEFTVATSPEYTIEEYEIIAIPPVHLKKLSKIDLSKQSTVFTFEAETYLKSHELEYLDGFSGTISFKLHKDVGESDVQKLNLSNMTYAVSMQNINDLNVMINSKFKAIKVYNLETLYFLMDHGFFEKLNIESLDINIDTRYDDISQLDAGPYSDMLENAKFKVNLLHYK